MEVNVDVPSKAEPSLSPILNFSLALNFLAAHHPLKREVSQTEVGNRKKKKEKKTVNACKHKYLEGSLAI